MLEFMSNAHRVSRARRDAPQSYHLRHHSEGSIGENCTPVIDALRKGKIVYPKDVIADLATFSVIIDAKYCGLCEKIAEHKLFWKGGPGDQLWLWRRFGTTRRRWVAATT